MPGNGRREEVSAVEDQCVWPKDQAALAHLGSISATVLLNVSVHARSLRTTAQSGLGFHFSSVRPSEFSGEVHNLRNKMLG